MLITLLIISGYLAFITMIAVPAFRTEPIPDGFSLAQLDARITTLTYTKDFIDQRIGRPPVVTIENMQPGKLETIIVENLPSDAFSNDAEVNKKTQQAIRATFSD